MRRAAAAAPWLSRSWRSGGVPEVFRPRLKVAPLGQHDRATGVNVGDYPVGGRAGEVCVSQHPPETVIAGYARVLGTVVTGDDDVAVGIGERTLALAVGAAGVGAGTLAALAPQVGEGPDRRVGAERTREPTHRLVADIVRPRAGDHPDVRQTL